MQKLTCLYFAEVQPVKTVQAECRKQPKKNRLMKYIFSIITLFSLCPLAAQPETPSYGRELPRSEIVSYPTAEEAAAGTRTDSRYLRPLTEWQRQDNTFSTTFSVPFAWANRSVLLGIASASADYDVRLNGKTVAYSADGSLPVEFDLTRSAKEGLNRLEIIIHTPSSVAPLESWKQTSAPAIGDAWVMSQPMMRIRDVFTRTWEADTDAKAEVGIIVKSGALNPKTSRIYYELRTPSNEVAAVGHKDITLDMRREDTLRFIASIPKHLLWSTELPSQYTLRLKTQYEGRYMEYIDLKPGFRTVEAKEGKLLINGRPETLKVRKVSPQITAGDIDTLKKQGYNTIWPETGSIPDSLYTMCDTIGVYVIAQAPIDTSRSGDSRRKGGNPSNDPAWLPFYLERTQNSYHTSKRHPSVIAFSLAEKSANGINLYESYLDMKRLEKERPVIYPDAGGEWNSDALLY